MLKIESFVTRSSSNLVGDQVDLGFRAKRSPKLVPLLVPSMHGKKSFLEFRFL